MANLSITSLCNRRCSYCFARPERLRMEKRVVWGKEESVYYYSYGTHQVWGLTARIIRDFMEALKMHL